MVTGNISEATTLRPKLERLLQRFEIAGLVIVVDCGLLSLDNIAQIPGFEDLPIPLCDRVKKR